ncbi:hypothetical protein [Actinoplanes sp. M2I2]|uniref:hypothetical protein n=1 Tax=Actinoplanes sp. M2I2 TaxID=1734444 RepID=UPI00202229ED|nr:hypothetical protein [Actinoplanes sp. M2I2]
MFRRDVPPRREIWARWLAARRLGCPRRPAPPSDDVPAPSGDHVVRVPRAHRRWRCQARPGGVDQTYARRPRTR